MKRHFFIVFFLLVFSFAFRAIGQTTTSITGTVLDQTGRVIPKASVNAHNVLTNQDFQTSSTSTGNFTFAYIQPGTYDVTATAPGFNTASETAIRLVLDATVTVKLVLKPGTVTEKVVIRADEVQLDQTRPDRGEVYSAEEIEGAPLDFGSPLSIANTEPGVEYTGYAQYARPFDNYNVNRFSANGQSDTGNDIQIDGTPDNAVAWGTQSMASNVPIQSVAEMKVITNPYDAQYGHTGGAVFDIVTKYGTNTLHGEAYENMRRSWLSAPSEYEDVFGLGKGKSWIDQYGIEADGPIKIPHFYDGKDKTFFALQWEGWRQGQPVAFTSSVIPYSPGSTTQTVAETGDFSEDYYYDGTCGCNMPTTIYDYRTFDNTVNGVGVARDPFPNNTIPSSMLNSTAQAILSYYPKPNHSTPAGMNWGIDNYVSEVNEPATSNSVTARVDHNFGPNDKAYLRFIWNKHFESDPYTGITNEAKQGRYLIRQNHSFAGDWVHTFNPNMILDFHLSFNRYVDNETFGTMPFDLSKIGWPSSYNSTMPGSVFPEFEMSEYTYLGGASGPSETITNSLGGLPSLTLVRGPHTLKIGVDYRLMHNSAYQDGWSSGETYVARMWTQAHWWYWGGYAEGNSWASMLEGNADSGWVNDNDHLYVSFPYMAAYAQDDWKVTHKLTVNLGVRYDLQFPPKERHNQTVSNFDTTSVNPINSVVAANLPTGVTLLGGNLFAGVNGQPRTFFNLDVLTLQPRIGFNYAVDSKTVVRAGIGTSYSSYTGYGDDQGFNQATAQVTSLNGDIWPTLNLSDPFPTITKPTGSSLGLETYVGDSFNISNRSFASPGVINYSLGVERQLNSHTTVDVSFVGSKGFHLNSSDDINHISPSFAAQCNLEMGATYTTYENCINYPASVSASGGEWVANPFYNVDAFETAGNNNGYYTNQYLSASLYTRPFPEFGEITQTEQNQGQSVFNSVQFIATHKWGNALTFHASYVRSKLTQQGGYADTTYRIKLHYLSLSDMPNRITFNGVWHLPVGKGRTYLGNANRLLDAAVGGWTLSPIYVWETGTPEGIGLEVAKKQHTGIHRETLNGARVIRGLGHCVEWYNPNDNYQLAFASGSNTTGCTLGDPDFIVRPSYAAVQDYPFPGIRQPNYQQFDVSLGKRFKVTDRTGLEFRMDAYNVMNHPTWDEGYNLDTSSSFFGTIDMDTTAQSNLPRDIQLSAKFTW